MNTPVSAALPVTSLQVLVAVPFSVSKPDFVDVAAAAEMATAVL
jgi:hypothetical protein